MSINKLALPISLLLTLSVSAYAKDSQRPQQGPPPEAIEACQNKNEGDLVSFTGPRNESLEGVCKIIKDQLVAVPKDMPENGGRPPQN